MRSQDNAPTNGTTTETRFYEIVSSSQTKIRTMRKRKSNEVSGSFDPQVENSHEKSALKYTSYESFKMLPCRQPAFTQKRYREVMTSESTSVASDTPRMTSKPPICDQRVSDAVSVSPHTTPSAQSTMFRTNSKSETEKNIEMSPTGVEAVDGGQGHFWERSLAWTSSSDDSDTEESIIDDTIEETLMYLCIPERLGEENECGKIASGSKRNTSRKKNIRRQITIPINSAQPLDDMKATEVHWDERIFGVDALEKLALLCISDRS